MNGSNGMPGIVRIKETREVKAELTAEKGGRLIAWHNDREPGLISIAAVGDRAKLTPAEARAIGRWLIENADIVSMTPGSVIPGLKTRTYR
jgi:hypothetical protein